MGSRLIVLFVVFMLSLGPLAQISGSDGDGSDRGPGPLDSSEVWTDSFDDMGNVYVPGAGLAGVEVVGGEVRLKTGETEGWIASSIISAKPGYRYDFVLLEATTPGNSSVQISILNATEEASEIGFANETIPGFKKVNGTYLSAYGIPTAMYPEIRIQVSLMADGPNLPTLQAWSLYYVPKDEWRDEFLGDWKMSDSGGLNFTGDALEVNTTSKSGAGPGGYRPYPPVATSGGSLIYPNTPRDDYLDSVDLGLDDTGPKWGVAYGDFDNDGFLDVLLACRDKSYILWGDDTGKYSKTRSDSIASLYYMSPGTGDFNGDGWTDIAFSGKYPSSGAKDKIYLNRGDGTFNATADIIFGTSSQSADVGDVNYDGYDDVMFGKEAGSASVFFGGPGVPDTTRDILFPGGNFWTQEIADLNNDGYLDVFLGSISGDKLTVYLGDANGIDTTPEFTIDLVDPLAGGVGDIDGDGYTDLVVYGEDSGKKIHIYEGDAQGWSVNRVHKTAVMTGLPGMAVADIDKDGYDDILITAAYQGNGGMKIFYGGPSWPTIPDASIPGGGGSLAIAIPRGAGGGTRTYKGTFTTEAIDIPPGNEMKWDMLLLEGTTPKNTSMTLSVLDGTNNPIPGYEDLSDWNVDLINLDAAIYPTIKVKVDVTSELNNTTPVLDKLTIKWMDKMTWRDQFYGDARADRIMGFDVMDGFLQTDPSSWVSPQLVFSSIRNDSGFNTKSRAYIDAGGLDYTSRPPMEFPTRGVSAFDVADIDGNGFLDILFAVKQTSDTNFATSSPLFLNSATGWRPTADHLFTTLGAEDVLLEDLNDDGYTDVVFAQEQDNGDYFINSTLFWGSASGWNDTADVAFVTNGASGVEAADFDADGDLDLVFACYKGTSTSTDSMVFTLDPSGFNGSSASLYLPTKGARAVAAGDLDKDTHVDLVFANSFSGGQAEIDSYIYWGNALGGFDPIPTDLPTVGAEDVKAADLDGDSYLDIVFANAVDNSQTRTVDSYVYLNDGSGGFGTTPYARLPTTGASAVAVGDLDGTGLMALVFACQQNGSSYSVPSKVYLGGILDWSSDPDFEIPTEGASDVMVLQLTKVGTGGYMSKAITPDPSDEPGGFHTFRYNMALGASQSGKVQLIDAVTEEVLAETPLSSGTNEWSIEDVFRYKEHPSIRVVVVGEGLDQPGAFEIDELWLNWTKRVKLPPIALDIELNNPTVYRTKTVRLHVNVSDEYDSPRELLVTVQHRVNGTGNWISNMLGPRIFTNGVWAIDVTPRVDSETGFYDFRVLVKDTDRLESGWVDFPNVLEVMNNLPTAPVINLLPARPDTTTSLQIEFVRGAQDVESTGLTYRYLWYIDGEFQPLLVADSVDASLTQKGQNWSVLVAASDGENEGPAAIAWRIIENAAPRIKNHLADPEMEEDTVDSNWLDLSTAFEDPDGDPLTWSIDTAPDHISVEIDPTTGKVTLTPEANWAGEVNITFIASDGELRSEQNVTVLVTPINDIPRFATVNGKPVGDGPVEITIKQGELLSIEVLVIDPEGDELVFDVNTTLFEVGGSTGSISWQPENDQVGTLRFGMTVWDVVTPSEKVTLDFIVVVENENDPMDDPRITTPTSGASFEEEILFSLIAICTDPDTIYGQILNFSWSSNMSGHLGYGSSLNIALTDVGTHVITLTVTDGDHQKMTTVNVIITEKADVTPPPPPDDNDGTDEPFNYAILLGIVIALVAVVALLFVVKTKKRTEELETADEEEYKREHMERAHVAVKAAADALEAGREEDVVTDVPLPELEEIDVESASTPQLSLSMEAKETEAASAQTMALFGAAATAEPAMSAEEQEQLKLDNLKRNYQNAIGRLPYGIPAKELQDWDWVELAGALATGEKRMTPDGRETTEIDGRWYYSDAKDTGSFLKEHGAKAKKPEPRKGAEVTTDKTVLLAKLEERFILGEISEETYKKLVDKYNEE